MKRNDKISLVKNSINKIGKNFKSTHYFGKNSWKKLYLK